MRYVVPLRPASGRAPLGIVVIAVGADPRAASTLVQVQSGGSFDIDWVVTDPSDTIIIEGERERQGDYIFTAHQVGEYSFCFSNDMSSFSEKLVDFDIMVESEPRPVAPAKPTALTEQTSSLEESIYKLSGSLSSIQRTQKYFRTRENRNVSSRNRPAKCVPHDG